jgi:SAM-dependent methyltransferase
MTNPTLKRDWQNYYDAVANRPPRKTVLSALAAFEKPGFAVDLGCGSGRDTVEILRQNWTVLAIDQEPEAITRLRDRVHSPSQQLTTQIARFEVVQLPKPLDLINASFSLPLCHPAAFERVWYQILDSLAVGGRFCGHLFGDRDSWRDNPLINFHSRAQVETLLTPYTIELLEEEEHWGQTPLGEDRYWHIFHIVARK